jgi:uncharacterized protein Usg
VVSTTLYGHYTTISGLMGIVKSETISATNIRFLNDEHEFQHALKLVGYIIQDSKVTPEFPNYVKYKDYIKRITSEPQTLDSYESENIFTFSFSEETD